MPFLEIESIHKEYENTPLLRGVSFTVARGEIACLLGSSGSGKTTLLRIIAGLEGASRGRVRLEGEDITNMPAHRRGIVLMFQDYALFPHKTVAENVAFGLRMQASNVQRQIRNTQYAVRTTREIASRVDDMLALVGLEDFGDRDVNELSGGEQQRVALARSLAPHPRLLLLDEPLGALDRNLRERLLEELPAILRRVGVTAITVTHDQEEAFAMTDRVILLHEGRVVQAGTPEEVYNAPANVWVARFLGLDNLLPAEVFSQRPPQVKTALGVLALGEDAVLPAPGTRGTLLVHPWGIRLTQRENTLPNVLHARVVRRAFHGARYLLSVTRDTIRLNFSQDLSATVPAPGEPVTIELAPRALRWL